MAESRDLLGSAIPVAGEVSELRRATGKTASHLIWVLPIVSF